MSRIRDWITVFFFFFVDFVRTFEWSGRISVKIQPNKTKFNDSKYFESRYTSYISTLEKTFDTVSLYGSRGFIPNSDNKRARVCRVLFVFLFFEREKKGGGNREKVRSWLLHTHKHIAASSPTNKRSETQRLS